MLEEEEHRLTENRQPIPRYNSNKCFACLLLDLSLGYTKIHAQICIVAPLMSAVIFLPVCRAIPGCRSLWTLWVVLNNLQDNVSCLFNAILRAGNLNGLALVLIAWNLDLRAGLLPDAVDLSAAGSNHVSVRPRIG